MAKKFAGFTQQQNEILAKRMGFSGPMDKFGEFLQSSPALAAKYKSFENKAQQALGGGVGFDTGGVVTQNTNSAGQVMTRDLINTPENLLTPVVTTPQTLQDGELVNQNSGQASASPNATTTTGTNTQATTPTQTQANTVTTTTASPQVNTALSGVNAAQGTVSQNAQVQAAQALPSADATVQGQLGKLMASFEGGQTPAWAAGAMRAANTVMAQRGLGSSSIAGSAITQAAMESAIGIAVADASTFSQFEMANLSNRQQARLVNAQAFLQMDLTNLSNEQQTSLFKAQQKIQSLFTDQAAENATKQFNATSSNQTEQFFSQLKSQVSMFNSGQADAMSQFNAGQSNSTEMFNRQMNEQREQFNAANRLIIDQSNATWRRQINTTNNATTNEANRINAQTASGMTLAAYNNLMQTERDFYSFAYEAGQNAEDRATQLAISKSGRSGSGIGSALGKLAGSIIGNLFK